MVDDSDMNKSFQTTQCLCQMTSNPWWHMTIWYQLPLCWHLLQVPGINAGCTWYETQSQFQLNKILCHLITCTYIATQRQQKQVSVTRFPEVPRVFWISVADLEPHLPPQFLIPLVSPKEEEFLPSGWVQSGLCQGLLCSVSLYHRTVELYSKSPLEVNSIFMSGLMLKNVSLEETGQEGLGGTVVYPGDGNKYK